MGSIGEGEKGYEMVYLARQPVFDGELRLWAHELLYRGGLRDRTALFQNKEEATLKVLAGMPLCHDFAMDSGILMINFPARAVMDHMYSAYPKGKTMVQLADSDASVPDITQEILSLKEKGYLFCMDDFEGRPENKALYSLADYITIDILGRKQAEIEAWAGQCRTCHGQARLIAKRIEEYDQYQMAKNMGFDYFQGYFFKRPRTDAGRKISSSQISKVKILGILQNQDVEFGEISTAIATDVSIVHRLLIYVNSPAMGIRKKISSIEEALVILGLSTLKKWLEIILITDVRPLDKPQELVRISAVRACFLDLLARENNLEAQADSLFALGLFSLLDALLDLPMADLVPRLYLDPDLKNSLLGKPSKYLQWLGLLNALEQGQWTEADKIAAGLDLDPGQIARQYDQAFNLAHAFFTKP